MFKLKEWTDNEILEGCCQGDPVAFEQLLQQYERLVFSIPLNFGCTRDDAEDVAQITFTIFIQQMDSLHKNSKLGAWLATVARRHTWRLLERRRREAVFDEGDLVEYDTIVGIEETDFDKSAILEKLSAGLNQLQERCRHLLSALYLDEKNPSYQEISQRLGMGLGSIGPTRARCLLKLRELMGEW